jgi:2-(1,2-epoxy-1,2-dihydrophenyl)acetyl-CoA isomerase
MTAPEGIETTSGPAEPVAYLVNGAVATIRLQRPKELNALDLAAKELLLGFLQRAEQDESVRVVVLTGSGPAFCAGQDLRQHVADLDALRAAHGADVPGAPEVPNTVREHYNPIVTLLSTMPKPVVAAVNGIAAGAGASFALACDFRVVADSAGFYLAFADVGLSCDSGGSWWLPRIVGAAKAKELLLLPRVIPAAEALSLGLATRVAPDGEFEAAVAELVGRLAAGPTVAYGAIRRAVAYSQAHDLADSLEHEAALMDLTCASTDHRASVEAFLAQRPTTFIGH